VYPAVGLEGLEPLLPLEILWSYSKPLLQIEEEKGEKRRLPLFASVCMNSHQLAVSPCRAMPYF